MATQVNLAEEIVKEINQNVFFKEFTFTENKLGGKDSDELADNIVWLDDILFLIQIKLRETTIQGTAEEEKKWFENKVMRKAKEQIKNTLSYFDKYATLHLPNGRGFKMDLKAAPVAFSKRIVMYYPGPNIANRERYKKFYVSKDIGFVHLFHLEDYQWVCQYLVTPFEINDYLQSRERLYEIFNVAIDEFPEQLLLGHYLSGDNAEDFSIHHIEYLTKFNNNLEEFDISGVIDGFFDRQRESDKLSDKYHYIIKELAKLHRSELTQFKQRYLLALEKRKENDFTIPYRIVAPSTECGFVFIPLPRQFTGSWETALQNFTQAHKYDQQLDKCVGIVFIDAPDDNTFVEVYWLFIESPWQKDEKYEKILGSGSTGRAS